MNKRIMVATDGEPGAMGAMRIARLLYERDGCHVAAVAVHEPTELYAFGAMGTATGFAPDYIEELASALEQRVTAQLAEVGFEVGRDCSVEVLTGSTAPSIARAAEEAGAELVLVGLRTYTLGERALGRETALRIIRLANVPVLGIPDRMTSLPTRIIVALDDGEFSIRAVHAVPSIMGAGATLHLAHALWGTEGEEPAAIEWMKTYRIGVEKRLSDLGEELAGRYAAKAEVHVLHGEPAAALLALADRTDAELIAAGSHGLGFLGRIFMGSVSSKLIRGAHCGVLVAPPAEPVAEPLATMSDREIVEALGRSAAAPVGEQVPATPPRG
jgi:nucleotide-binding universal stress UspA family protein